MNRKRLHFITLGPPIPIVPVSHFTPLPLDQNQLAEVWKVIGPSVEHNMRKNAPLWEIFAAAYLEGLNHGAALMEERLKPKEPTQGELF